MSSVRWVRGLCAAVVMTAAGSAAAEAPVDPGWIARKGHAVVVEKQDGSRVAGTLVAVGDGGVEVEGANGSRSVIERSAVKAVRSKLRGTQVTVTMGSEDAKVSGRLVESDEKTIIVETDDGGRAVLDRAVIKTVRERLPEEDLPRSPPAKAPPWSLPAKAPDAQEAQTAEPSSGVPARKGFQMALSTGYSFALGSADGTTSQSDFVSGQVPLMLEIGGRFVPSLFFGVYFGGGFGGAGNALSTTCAMDGVSCSSWSIRGGAETIFYILPSARFNPYIGYGFGFEATQVNASSQAASASLMAFGVDYGRLTVGVDYRLNRIVGFGPFVNVALGQYSDMSVQSPTLTQSGELAEKALHTWLTIGARATLFP